MPAVLRQAQDERGSSASGRPTVAIAVVGLKVWHHLPDMFRKGEMVINVRLASIQTVYSSFKIKPEIY